MAAARLAPVLSATSKIDRICNILPLSSFYGRGDVEDFFNHRDQPPALQFRHGAGFLDADTVPHSGFVLFIVGIELLITSDYLFKFGMREPALYAHHDRFPHLIRNNFANAFLAVPAGSFWCLSHLSHTNYQAALVFALFRSSEMRVSSLAMSRRKVRNLPGFSN